jgi:signal transduction histidine kinase
MTNITEQSGRQIISFGALMSLNQPIYQLIWYFESQKNYQNIGLRFSAWIISLALVFSPYWPRSWKQYMPAFWYFSLWFCLPFFFTFMSLKSHLGTTWMMNSMSALFFIFLIIDFISACFLIVTGTLAGIYFFNLTTPELIIAPGIVTMNGLLATFMAAFVIGGIFARNNEIIRQEKFQTLHALSASVAHEFRTPLAAIKFAMAGLDKYLPKLLQAYEAAQLNEGISVPKIRSNQIKLLQNMPTRIDKLLYQANLSIDMMLMNATQLKLNQMEFTSTSIRQCVLQAIDQYPFKSKKQGELVTIREDFEDFDFIGSELLVIHVFFNLMKNALYFVDANRKGEIEIWTEKMHLVNRVFFKDTAQGIKMEHMKHLFKQFHSNREGGTGVGLSFCKMVLNSMNGEIACHSNYGEHTTFVLTFPKVLN